MKDIPAVRGGSFLARAIAEGEHERQDFKYAISDARKIARTLSAFANNAGGRLLVGVRDNGSIAGVRSEEDIYVIEQAAQLYCVPEQELKIDALKAPGGAIVIRAEIQPSEVRPVRVREQDGRLRAYFRVADENIAAHPLMVRAWLAAARTDSAPAVLGATETTLLQALRDAGGTAPLDSFIASLPISRALAERTIVALANLQLVSFRHTPAGFLLSI